MDLLSHSSECQASAVLAEHSSRPLPQGQIQGSSWPGFSQEDLGQSASIPFRMLADFNFHYSIAGVLVALLLVTQRSYLYFKEDNVFFPLTSHFSLPQFSLVFSQTISSQIIRLCLAGLYQTFFLFSGCYSQLFKKKNPKKTNKPCDISIYILFDQIIGQYTLQGMP